MGAGDTSRLFMTLHLLADTRNDYQGDVVRFDFMFRAAPYQVRPGTRTLGYYNNHGCVLGTIVARYPIDLAGDPVSTVEEGSTHRDRMKRQLLVTKLNMRAFGIGPYDLLDIGETVEETVDRAEVLLASGATTEEELSDMTDLLDRINNYNTEAPLPDWLSELCPSGA